VLQAVDRNLYPGQRSILG